MKRHTSLAAAVAALVLSLSAATPTPAAASTVAVTCQNVTVSATLATLPISIDARLCVPQPAPQTVQLLLHGGTYNSVYWDFPFEPQTYSYADAANARGFATLNIDRVGYGNSTRTLSAALTATGQADVVHQIVAKLHAGTIGSVAFPKVILVGHSMGSATAAIEASLYHDVQGVILTGFTHRLSGPEMADIFTTGTHPALLDPQFGLSYDPGYVTTVPGMRDDLYYAPGDFDPDVVATDEATKDVASGVETADDSALAFTAPTSLTIQAPVLVAVGSKDRLFCGAPSVAACANAAALKAAEDPYFSPAAQLATYVLPDAGHNINLSVRAPQVQTAMLDWAHAHVGL